MVYERRVTAHRRGNQWQSLICINNFNYFITFDTQETALSKPVVSEAIKRIICVQTLQWGSLVLCNPYWGSKQGHSTGKWMEAQQGQSRQDSTNMESQLEDTFVIKYRMSDIRRSTLKIEERSELVKEIHQKVTAIISEGDVHGLELYPQKWPKTVHLVLKMKLWNKPSRWFSFRNYHGYGIWCSHRYEQWKTYRHFQQIWWCYPGGQWEAQSEWQNDLWGHRQ